MIFAENEVLFVALSYLLFGSFELPPEVMRGRVGVDPADNFRFRFAGSPVS
jgi:hypothetical protein